MKLEKMLATAILNGVPSDSDNQKSRSGAKEEVSGWYQLWVAKMPGGNQIADETSSRGMERRWKREVRVVEESR
jgi:hypothetical protein